MQVARGGAAKCAVGNFLFGQHWYRSEFGTPKLAFFISEDHVHLYSIHVRSFSQYDCT